MDNYNYNNAIASETHSASKVLRHVHEITGVSGVFFSQLNFDVLHEAIRYLVYKYSECKHRIARQSDRELEIVMRGIYLQHAKNNPFNVLEQVRELNAMVLDFAVPRILREIAMYTTYKDAVFKNPTPLERPSFVSSAGSRSVEFKKTLI